MCRICIFCEKCGRTHRKTKNLILSFHGWSHWGAVSRRVPTDLRCGNPFSTNAWNEYWKISEVARKKLPQIFSARSERERNMLPDRVAFQTNHPLKQAAAFPENDTCISTICACGISITRLTVEPMPG